VNGQSDKERLIGSWRHIGSTVDGKPRPGQGANPTGIIIYDAHGYMACQVAPDREVTKAGDKPTGDEAKAALDGHVAYFGKYSVDERDLVRGYEFAGDRLILKPIGTTTEVLWERIK
jgi:hypothetical protein